MALEEKRVLEEILIRPNSLTNGGNDGIAITHRTYVEKDGVEMPGTSSNEGPKPSDWSDPEVTDRIGDVAAALQQRVNELVAQKSELEAERDSLKSQVISLQETG